MKNKKSIGLWSAVSIGIGGMIGAGIFSILGVSAQIAGHAMYISFLIAGLIALLCTYSYAKLGSTYPSAGGPVEFLVKGFGDNVLSGGFNILLWIGYVFALSLYAKAFGGYAMTFLPPDSPGIWLYIFITLIILVFTGINFVGAKAVGKSEIFIVVTKVAILFIFVVIGFLFIDPSRLALSNLPQTTNIFFGTAIVFLAYEGFGLITNTAEEMKNPKKTLPRALYLAVIITLIIYVLVSITVLGNLPIGEIIGAKDYALAAAAEPFLGKIGFIFIAIAALFSTSSAINATLYGGANVSYTIAKHGELPKIFERKIWGRSTEGLFITSLIVLFFANFLELEGIAMLGSASFLLIYGAVNVSHLKLYKETGAKPLIIVASVISCIIFFCVLTFYEINHSPITLLILILVILSCFTIEWIYRKISKRILKTRK
jgi:amino acid transporter